MIDIGTEMCTETKKDSWAWNYQQLLAQKQSIQATILQLSNACNEPLCYNAIRNVLVYRLHDVLRKNHPQGLMALYLIYNLIQRSNSDRIVIEALNNFSFYANVLAYTKINRPSSKNKCTKLPRNYQNYAPKSVN